MGEHHPHDVAALERAPLETGCEIQLAITNDMVVAVMGCVVNGPGEARETDIGLTGGGQGNHMVYLSGVTDHKITDDKLVDHIVELVEEKAAEIAAAEAQTAHS